MVKVYYSDITKITANEKILDKLPLVRKQYVTSISDEKRRKQSVFIWLLLEYVLKESCGKSDYTFFVENGEWLAKDCEFHFSLSHSDNIVAVAISNGCVGVDVEKCDKKVLRLASKLSDFSSNDINMMPLSMRLVFKIKNIHIFS